MSKHNFLGEKVPKLYIVDVIHQFLIGQHKVLNKDLTVWLHGDRLANTCIPPSSPGDTPMQLLYKPNPKNTFESIVN
jgi:hypothetical protein